MAAAGGVALGAGAPIAARVRQLRLESETVCSVELEPVGADRLPPWSPGAHIDLHLPNGRTRQYSLCGDPSRTESYRIAVLREPASTGGSEYVHTFLRPGQRVGIGGPRNHFGLQPYPHVQFIAGGIGITPLLPMMAALGDTTSWHLHYAGRSRSSMAFVPELLDRYPGRVSIQPADTDGRLDLGALIGSLPAGSAVYACGPGSLLDALARAQQDHPGVVLQVERFAASAKEHLPDSAHTVRCARSAVSVQVPTGKSFLAALREAEVAVASSCADGLCGTCEVRVLDGIPEHRDDILSGADRERRDLMYVCVSRGLTEELVLDL